MSIQSTVPYLQALFPTPKTDKSHVDAKPVVVERIAEPNPSQADQVALSPRSPESTERKQAESLSKLTTAIAENQLAEAKTIAAQITDPDLKAEYRPPLLHFFAKTNHETAVKMIVQDLNRNINALDDCGRSALHVINDQQAPMAEFLIALGANPNNLDHQGRTPLLTAILKKEPLLAKTLLHHAQTDLNFPDDFGNTPLMKAIQTGNLEIVQLLAEDARVDLYFKNSSEKNSFNEAAKKGEEFTQVLEKAKAARLTQVLEKTLDLQAVFCSADGNKHLKKLTLKQDSHGNNALHRAAAGGNIGWVKVLTESLNPELSQRNADGKTAFQLAMQNGHQDIARFLLASPWRQAQKKITL